MWLHILKKDLRLHWLYVAAVIAVKVTAVWLILQIGILAIAEPVRFTLSAFSELAFAGVAGLAIIVVVQSDPVISNNDDWLIRPIHRRDLALAKIVFAALVTLVPAFVFNLAVGLRHGVDVRPAIGAAADTALVTFISIGLPALAVATITASWLQAVGIVFVIFLTWIASTLMIDYQPAAIDSWPVALALQVILVIATALILGLQYGRRNAATARGVFAVAALCALAVTVTPRTIDDQIRHIVDDGKVAATGPIRLSYRDRPNATVIGTIAPQHGIAVILIPLNVMVDPDRVVAVNHIDVSIASGDGKPLYRGAVSLLSSYAPIQFSQFLSDTLDGASNGQQERYQAVNLPRDIFAKLKSAPASMSLTYQLSAYAPVATANATLTLGVAQKVAGFGTCETQLNAVKKQAVDLFCIPATNSSNCLSARVLDPTGASMGAQQTRCSTTTTLWGLNTKALTAPGQFVMELPAASGAATRPLTLTAYRVTRHFTQTVVVPQVKLTDITGSAGSAGST